VRGWNLSYESLTSFEVHEKLRNLKADNPGFWSELSMEKEDTTLPVADNNVPEDAVDVEEEDSYGDDSSIPLSAIVDTVISGKGDSGLVSQDLARDDNKAPADEIDGQDDKDLGVHTTVSKEASNSVVSSMQPPWPAEGQGKRMKISNKWYTVKSFIHHNDDDDWRIDI
jgi:hypothetical protein